MLHTGQNFGGPKHGPVPKARTHTIGGEGGCRPHLSDAHGGGRCHLPRAVRQSSMPWAMAAAVVMTSSERRVDLPPEVSSSSIRVNPAVPATMEAGASSRSADVVTMEATSAVCPPSGEDEVGGERGEGREAKRRIAGSRGD